MTATTNNDNAPRKHSRPRKTIKWGHLLIGVVLVLLAVGSVLSTTYTNKRQAQLVECGIGVVAQTNKALRARDDAQIAADSSVMIIVRARQAAYHALADAVTGRNKSNAAVDQAIDIYDRAVEQYLRAVEGNNQAIANAPLPTIGCLGGR
jgi:hypothetical protein